MGAIADLLMTSAEEQETEWEVLLSIYEGDGAFKKISETRMQYRVDGERSFVMEIEWPAEYPSIPPKISLDVFYNSHIAEADRSAVRDALLRVAEENQGMAVSFTLIEHAKEHADELTAGWTVKGANRAEEEGGKEDTKKELLSKAAKRKAWDRVGAGGEKERGHDWVDIIKHLSQTRDTP